MKESPVPEPRQFATTHWSLVDAAKAGQAGQTRACEALEELCRTYWYPLYAFVRSRGYSAHDAQYLLIPLALPASVKFGIVCVSVTAILLISYDLMIRYTWVGTLLNGKRVRPKRVAPTRAVRQPSVASGDL